MTEVFGLPVEGNIGHYSRRSIVEQYPLESLEPYIKSMLDDENVIKFGWVQYTPYFNDGDPCTFSAGVVFAVTPETLKENPDEDDFYEYDHDIRSYAFGDRPASPKHHVEFGKQIESGHYDVALEQAFGDPATVIITREGITVEYYDHG